eukprot:CAMPEP_0170532030 /NCGR_PEP_ID=MMETSP0209-20121228/67894_1 /TAXON_ID=665100 ORGANISM="Litonotus pictus, Strain P1" /NCGR_SAMPLE_ID=MMETSP0209 /ASSEMBLY_ACC=CAM_ASM_000301 /LENGTH=269 /DNA_ID=CAMNT_0010827575 /DNA_START=363 /DNA_END=1169 /DNA_ORIENTATION=+
MPPMSLNNNNTIKRSSGKPYQEYYVKLLQNNRESMEDFHLIGENFNGKESQALFGLFDGHGGIEVARKLKDEVNERFCKLLNGQHITDSAWVEQCLKNLFRKLDEEIIKQYTVATEFESTNFKSLGSTCTLLYLCKENKETVLYSANIGDTRGIIASKNGPTRITYEHKPSDDFENKRIKNSGGVIFSGRIFGQFGLTRAFGNIPLKKWVIAEPFLKRSVISDHDRFAIIASDGIWDVISDEECFEISLKHINPKVLCEELVNTAISRW